ncbi:MAG: hypothetical protein ACK4N5_02305, partial [Myxococcales bacterium]
GRSCARSQLTATSEPFTMDGRVARSTPAVVHPNAAIDRREHGPAADHETRRFTAVPTSAAGRASPDRHVRMNRGGAPRAILGRSVPGAGWRRGNAPTRRSWSSKRPPPVRHAGERSSALPGTMSRVSRSTSVRTRFRPEHSSLFLVALAAGAVLAAAAGDVRGGYEAPPAAEAHAPRTQHGAESVRPAPECGIAELGLPGVSRPVVVGCVRTQPGGEVPTPQHGAHVADRHARVVLRSRGRLVPAAVLHVRQIFCGLDTQPAQGPPV